MIEKGKITFDYLDIIKWRKHVKSRFGEKDCLFLEIDELILNQEVHCFPTSVLFCVLFEKQPDTTKTVSYLEMDQLIGHVLPDAEYDVNFHLAYMLDYVRPLLMAKVPEAKRCLGDYDTLVKILGEEIPLFPIKLGVGDTWREKQ